jgi:hypothetical protein
MAFRKSLIKSIFSFKNNLAFSSVLNANKRRHSKVVNVTSSPSTKEEYNLHYDKVLDRINFGHLLKLPDLVGGYILDINCNNISKVDAMTHNDRFGIVKTHDQVKGMAAFCTLSQILPVFNEGWEPDWTDGTPKSCIETVGGDIHTAFYFNYANFLAFETQEKAKL